LVDHAFLVLLRFSEHVCLVVLLLLHHFLSGPVDGETRNAWFICENGSLDVFNDNFFRVILNILWSGVVVIDVVSYLFVVYITKYTLKNSYFLYETARMMAVIPRRSSFVGMR
jgi:hypothetical protein